MKKLFFNFGYLFLLVIFVASIYMTTQFRQARADFSPSLQQKQTLSQVVRDQPISLLPKETYFGGMKETSIDQVIKSHNLTIYSEDKYRFFPDPKLRLGTTIEVFRATPITIIDANKSTIYRTWQKDVTGLLAEKKIELGENDKISPAVETTLEPNQTITIIRVSITQIKTSQAIDFQTIRKADANLDKGVEKIEQTGKKGERVLTYEVRRENGVEKSRQLLDNQVSREPVEQIIIFGTKEVVYGQGKAKWYFGVGKMSAAHNSLPFGTQVMVTSVTSGKSVAVTIKDRGIQGDAIIDLSPDAFQALAPLGAGVIQVRLTKP